MCTDLNSPGQCCTHGTEPGPEPALVLDCEEGRAVRPEAEVQRIEQEQPEVQGKTQAICLLTESAC